MKTITLRLEDEMAEELKNVSEMYHKNLSEFLREGLKKLLEDTKKDWYYRMQNVPYCDDDEEKELTEILQNMSEDDMKIVRTEIVEI